VGALGGCLDRKHRAWGDTTKPSSTGQQLGIGKADYSMGGCEVFLCAAVARPGAWKERGEGEACWVVRRRYLGSRLMVHHINQSVSTDACLKRDLICLQDRGGNGG
jgi:hypothetical protein